MQKTCVKCDKQYDYTRKNGTTTKHCSSCISRIRRQAIYEKIEKYVGGFRCSVCGYNKCKRAISFHHRDPTTKKFTLSQDYWMYSWERVRQEIDKCVLLCLNCHMEYESGLIPFA